MFPQQQFVKIHVCSKRKGVSVCISVCSRCVSVCPSVSLCVSAINLNVFGLLFFRFYLLGSFHCLFLWIPWSRNYISKVITLYYSQHVYNLTGQVSDGMYGGIFSFNNFIFQPDMTNCFDHALNEAGLCERSLILAVCKCKSFSNQRAQICAEGCK